MTPDLSQEELSEISKSISENSVHSPTSSEATPFDLTATERIDRGQTPGLEIAMERFSRLLSPALDSLFAAPSEVFPASIEKLKFSSIAKSLSVPCSIHLFRLAPLPGEAFLVISNELVYSTVDILLGGTGNVKSAGGKGEFTDLENRLVGKLAIVILDALEEALRGFASISCNYVRPEFSPLGLGSFHPTDDFFTCRESLSIKDASADFAIYLPSSLLSPIRDKLRGHSPARSPSSNPTEAKLMQEHIEHVLLNLSVELARGRIKAKRLLNLKPGDVITLDTRRDSSAVVRVEGREKFRARVGERRGNRAAVIVSGIRR